MKLRSCDKRRIKKGTRVLMRVDFNVPLQKGKIDDVASGRVRAPVPDILSLSKRGAKVILLTHIGRPHGKVVSELRTGILKKPLEQLLKRPVVVSRELGGPSVRRAVEALPDGGILLLENLRFDAGETSNSLRLASLLAELGDLYVNNAFAVCHRKHASVVALATRLPSCAGSVLQEEVSELSKPLADPLVLMLGGVKWETKLALMKQLAPQASSILLGSGIAAAMRSARGEPVALLNGPLPSAEKRKALQLWREFEEKFVFPTDVRVVASSAMGRSRLVSFAHLSKADIPIDIGPETIQAFHSVVRGAKSIIWNGPMGMTERKEAEDGTLAIAEVVRKARARTLVGGGDTLYFLESRRKADGFSFTSTGGGAMLAFLAGQPMPGLEVLT